VAVPHYLWRLPWHGGRVAFDCEYDESGRRYARYRMATRSEWAPAKLELEDTGECLRELPGFPDLERGRVVLTHPFKGVFYRRDGRLGTYSVWHDPLELTTGRLLRAEFGLFDRLGVVPFAEQLSPHSVLIQRLTEFAIGLPPTRP
jgi:hypothetical protein